MEKTIRVTLLGREYPLRVEEQHEGFTARVAELVDERARELERAASGHTALTHMALTALSLGEELLALREQVEGIQHLESEAEALTKRLDAALESGGDGAGASAGTRKKAPARRAKPARKAADAPESRASDGRTPADPAEEAAAEPNA